jgi:hypothetical protein
LREELRVRGLNEPVSHYADAVRWGDLLFISGLAPLDEAGGLVGEDDVAAQTRQIFRNMAKILEAAGAGFEDVLRVDGLSHGHCGPAQDQSDPAGILRRNPARQHARRGECAGGARHEG